MGPGSEIVVVLLGLGGLGGATVGSSVGSGVVVLGGGAFAFNSRGAGSARSRGCCCCRGLAWWMRGTRLRLVDHGHRCATWWTTPGAAQRAVVGLRGWAIIHPCPLSPSLSPDPVAVDHREGRRRRRRLAALRPDLRPGRQKRRSGRPRGSRNSCWQPVASPSRSSRAPAASPWPFRLLSSRLQTQWTAARVPAGRAADRASQPACHRSLGRGRSYPSGTPFPSHWRGGSRGRRPR